MDNHPIPQNVTGFEFKLIGDMTLKQFAYLAGGSLLSYLTFLLQLPFFIKWPLLFVFALFGISLAFVPIAGRPMDRMLLNFIKALLAENQYIFRKTPTLPDLPAPQPAIEPQPLETVSQPIPQPASGRDEQGGPSAQTPQPLPNPIPSAPTPPITGEIMPPSLLKHTVDLRMQPQKLPSRPKIDKPRTEVYKEPIESVSPPNVLSQPTPAQFANSPFTRPTPVPSFPNLISGRVLDTKGDFVPGVVIEVKDESGLALRAFKTNKLGQFASLTPLPNGTYVIELEDTLNRFTFMPTRLTLDGKEVPPLEIKPVDARDELRKELFTTS